MPVRARVRLRKKEVDALIETLDDRREMPIVAPTQTKPIAVADAAVAVTDALRSRFMKTETVGCLVVSVTEEFCCVSLSSASGPAAGRVTYMM